VRSSKDNPPAGEPTESAWLFLRSEDDEVGVEIILQGIRMIAVPVSQSLFSANDSQENRVPALKSPMRSPIIGEVHSSRLLGSTCSRLQGVVEGWRQT
jgi:hypothetical protein